MNANTSATSAGRTRSVVITGASTGIGRTTALHLNRAGWRVFAGVRRDTDGESLVAAASSPDTMVPIIMDVTKADQVRSALAQVSAAVEGAGGLDGYFSNAGILDVGCDVSAEGLPLDRLQRTLDVNFIGAVRGMQAFLPLIRAAKGVIVVNSALMTHTVLPYNGAYAPSKAALEAWVVALRREVRPFGVKVTIIRAAGIHSELEARQDPSVVPADSPYREQTAFLAGGAAMADARKGSRSMDPNTIAVRVQQALERRSGKPYRIVGAGAVPIWLVGALPARLQDRAISRAVKALTAKGRNSSH